MPQDAGPFDGAPGASHPAVGRRRPAVPSAILAMIIIVAIEAMFFAGLISAFLIVKAGIKPGLWPPPWQPRLPVEATAVNTAILVLSGVLLLVAGLRRRPAARPNGRIAQPALYAVAAFLGAFFVVFQGVEWSRLLGQGLTMLSSNHGAFFYLIVGTHALHAVGGLLGLAWGAQRLWRGTLTRPQLSAIQIFWVFVVGLWPVLYVLVYL